MQISYLRDLLEASVLCGEDRLDWGMVSEVVEKGKAVAGNDPVAGAVQRNNHAVVDSGSGSLGDVGHLAAVEKGSFSQAYCPDWLPAHRAAWASRLLEG